MADDDTGGCIIGLVVLCAIGYGAYTFFDKKSEADQKQQQEIQELKAKIADLENKKPEHHYELRNEGLRTFRFDPATGESCIQLTTEADWKRPDTMRQGCQYEEMLAKDGWASAECYLVNNQKACDVLFKPK
jgi:hypothetical protein